MRVVVGFLAISAALSSPTQADVGFFIDSDELIECGNLGEIAEGFARHKRAGLSANEMRSVMMDGGVYPEIADVMVRTLYSFDAAEPATYSAIVGALCILDKLQPIELDR